MDEFEIPEEFLEKLREAIEAEPCVPCDGKECEYHAFCRMIRSMGVDE